MGPPGPLLVFPQHFSQRNPGAQEGRGCQRVPLGLPRSLVHAGPGNHPRQEGRPRQQVSPGQGLPQGFRSLSAPAGGPETPAALALRREVWVARPDCGRRAGRTEEEPLTR